jgi:hypothetical protein
MDPWLTDQVKELLFRPCLAVSGYVGRRLNNRLQSGQEIDERALTEDLVDRFDSSSSSSAWGTCAAELRDLQIYISTSVRKSTVEHRTGADIGLVLRRSLFGGGGGSMAEYACLIQCKRADRHGAIDDFYHKVGHQKDRQSALMLDVTPSAFYFLFVPPALVQHYCSVEPLAFLRGAPGCSVPIWNLGRFAHDGLSVPFLTSGNKEDASGILVLPALAVDAQQPRGKSATLHDVLPNCLPFWYWFGELLVPGFVGDRTERTLAIAKNVSGADVVANLPFGVRFSMEVALGNG